MVTIVTRAGKGSALTWTEGDNNITNLNNGKLENIVEDTTPQLGGNLDVNGNSIVSVSNANITIAPNGTGKVVLSGVSWPAASGGGGGATGNVTSTSGISNRIYVNSTTGLSNDQAVTFTNAATIGLSSMTTYYIKDLSPISGSFQVSTSIGGMASSLSTQSSVTGVTYSTGGGGGGPTNGQVLTYNTGGSTSWTTPSSGSSTLSSLTDVQVTTPSTGQVLAYSSATSKWVNQSGGITSVSQDAAPSLGGNLTVMGYSIVSTSNGNISITPNGTGSIVLDGQSWPQADGTANQVLKTNGSGQLSWTTPSSGGGGNSIVIIGSAGGDPGTLNFNTNSSGSRPTDNFRLIYSGGVSGVSVSSNTFTLPAGTYVLEFPWMMTSGTPYRLTAGPSYDFASRIIDDYNGLVIQTSSGGGIGGAGNSTISVGVTTQFTLGSSTSLSFYKNGNMGNDYMSLLDRSNMGHTSLMFKFIKIA